MGTSTYNVLGINTFETIFGLISAGLTATNDLITGQTNVSLTQGSFSGQIGGGTMTSGVTQVIGALNPVGTVDFILDLYASYYNLDKVPVIGNNNAFSISFDW